jgi:hypothetical protein
MAAISLLHGVRTALPLFLITVFNSTPRHIDEKKHCASRDLEIVLLALEVTPRLL